MPFAAALFDLDGTLLNTIPDLTDAANAMRLDLGLRPLSNDVIATYVGKGVENLVLRAISNDLEKKPDAIVIRHALRVFRQRYYAVNGDKTLIYPGVIEGLKAFQEQGTKMAIVTNKPAEFTHPLLQRMGLMPFFQHIVSGDTCAHKKPHPLPMLHACELLGVAPKDTLVIGDSINDAQAARAAGMTVLAVPYGYNEGHNVQSLPVDDIVTGIDAAAQWAQQH